MRKDPRAVRVAQRAADLAAALGMVLADDLAIFRMAGGRPSARPVAGEPDDLGAVLEAATGADERLRNGVHFTPRSMAEELIVGAWPDGSGVTVGDPACGGGALLLAAGRRMVACGASPAEALERLWGADLDPVAVATTEAALSLWAGAPVPPGHLTVADALADDLGWPPLDLVVANPPFLSQLAAATVSDRARVAVLRARFGDVVRAYTDPAGLFVLRSVELSAPGGRIGLVLPQSLLGARDAAALRDEVSERARIRALWVPAGRFDAQVEVCLAALEIGPRDDRPWAAHLADRLGVPTVDLAPGPTVGDRAVVMASFRQEYYGLVPGVAEAADSPSGRPLVTTGRIGLGALLDRPTRVARRVWQEPVVDRDAVDDRGRQWIDRTAVPKVLVATQTRVVEVVVDERGDAVPLTPVIAVAPASIDLWSLAAALAAPPVSAWIAARVAGTALSSGALRVSAPLVRSIPLPADESAWRAGAEAFRAGDLDTFATAMTAAYGGSAGVLAWWRPLAERVWSPRG